MSPQDCSIPYLNTTALFRYRTSQFHFFSSQTYTLPFRYILFRAVCTRTLSIPCHLQSILVNSGSTLCRSYRIFSYSRHIHILVLLRFTYPIQCYPALLFPLSAKHSSLQVHFIVMINNIFSRSDLFLSLFHPIISFSPHIISSPLRFDLTHFGSTAILIYSLSFLIHSQLLLSFPFRHKTLLIFSMPHSSFPFLI